MNVFFTVGPSSSLISSSATVSIYAHRLREEYTWEKYTYKHDTNTTPFYIIINLTSSINYRKRRYFGRHWLYCYYYIIYYYMIAQDGMKWSRLFPPSTLLCLRCETDGWDSFLRMRRSSTYSPYLFWNRRALVIGSWLWSALATDSRALERKRWRCHSNDYYQNIDADLMIFFTHWHEEKREV